jgi:hypothetical protein
VVGNPPADRIELYALSDYISVGRDFASTERQHLRGQHLQLQRYGELVLRPPRTKPREHFAGDEYLARRPPLQAIEISEPLRIGFVCPVEPELLHFGLEFWVRDQR